MPSIDVHRAILLTLLLYSVVFYMIFAISIAVMSCTWLFSYVFEFSSSSPYWLEMFCACSISPDCSASLQVAMKFRNSSVQVVFISWEYRIASMISIKSQFIFHVCLSLLVVSFIFVFYIGGSFYGRSYGLHAVFFVLQSYVSASIALKEAFYYIASISGFVASIRRSPFRVMVLHPISTGIFLRNDV